MRLRLQSYALQAAALCAPGTQCLLLMTYYSLQLLTRYNQMSTPDGDVSVLGFRATRDLRQGETILCVTTHTIEHALGRLVDL